ncbi:hypothetical protein GLOTRDRAFT_128729 [Gloeophyllum trabeum ATCC 11539]|uniref:Uncharacterized protein n=1 Tax=Gloeophyllum trabeum (strain ATCC 11539 / FP-39264 / Madison 617) TaxID=670483 RepID=S7Q7S5_GLOTA|nr:uncharacterized protein GLOTRDRAFT_128729 [Gloeophyllum trabeum ATCC 11539]EPQ55498.1 hypothetical protein GLOTRDRAFT_128729 [Gloeophyllum trabeum ATCC 11539]
MSDQRRRIEDSESLRPPRWRMGRFVVSLLAKANSARALPQALHANDAKLSSSSTTPSVSTAAPQASGSPWSTDDVSDGQEHDIVNHHTEGENNPKDVSTDDSAVSLGILVDGVESGSTADGASLQVSVTPAEVVSGALVGVVAPAALAYGQPQSGEDGNVAAAANTPPLTGSAKVNSTAAPPQVPTAGNAKLSTSTAVTSGSPSSVGHISNGEEANAAADYSIRGDAEPHGSPMAKGAEASGELDDGVEDRSQVEGTSLRSTTPLEDLSEAYDRGTNGGSAEESTASEAPVSAPAHRSEVAAENRSLAAMTPAEIALDALDDVVSHGPLAPSSALSVGEMDGTSAAPNANVKKIDEPTYLQAPMKAKDALESMSERQGSASTIRCDRVTRSSKVKAEDHQSLSRASATPPKNKRKYLGEDNGSSCTTMRENSTVGHESPLKAEPRNGQAVPSVKAKRMKTEKP